MIRDNIVEFMKTTYYAHYIFVVRMGPMADGHVKYVAKHEVQGRVQLLRLLNPSALFETDGKGNKASGEVGVL